MRARLTKYLETKQLGQVSSAHGYVHCQATLFERVWDFNARALQVRFTIRGALCHAFRDKTALVHKR